MNIGQDATRQLEQAKMLHRQGRLAEATAIYGAALARDPRWFEPHYLFALANFQQGNVAEAYRLVSRALELKPCAAEALAILAGSLVALNRPAEALAACDRILVLSPNDVEAACNRATILTLLDRIDEAIEQYGEVLARRSDLVAARFNRGTLLARFARYSDALADFDRVLASAPDHLDALKNRGNVLVRLDRPLEALVSYDRILAARPDDIDALSNRGATLRSLDRNAEALASYEKALAVNPRHANALLNYGNVLYDMRRFEAALGLYDRLLELAPNDIDVLAGAWSNRGLVLSELNRHDEALASCEKGVALQPDAAYVHNNRGEVFAKMHRDREALASYEQAIAVNAVGAEKHPGPRNMLGQDAGRDETLARYDRTAVFDLAQSYFAVAFLKIRLGEWKEGWELYEWRWRTKGIEPFRRAFDCPLWLGKDTLADKAILLHAEQGLGDAMLFCRYVPMVEALGAKVVVEVPVPLVGLVSTVSPSAQVVAKGSSLPDCGFHCPLSSLPLAFGTTPATVPTIIPYLAVQADKQKEWRERLGVKTKPRVGLVWSGSGKLSSGPDFKRNIPFAQFQRIMMEGVDYCCLQKDIGPADSEVITNRSDVAVYADLLESFADTAALVSEMDLVISIDTSVAHLAGALGRAVWILLRADSPSSFLAPISGRKECVWYPAARLFTQQHPGHWDSVLSQVIEEQRTFLLANAE
jgi:tetratricopeptide (TPR) repeat protein